MSRDVAQRKAYDPLSQLFHWLMALAIPLGFGLGLYMVELPLSPDKLRYYAWHKWLGVSLFACACLRLLWSQFRRPVAVPQRLAHWGHRLLYLLMIAVPVSGWLMSSAKGVSTVLFGVWALPDLLMRDAQLGRQLQTLHLTLNYTLAVLVAGHIAMAFRHHWLDRDEVLHRMLPAFLGGARR